MLDTRSWRATSATVRKRPMVGGLSEGLPPEEFPGSVIAPRLYQQSSQAPLDPSLNTSHTDRRPSRRIDSPSMSTFGSRTIPS